MKIISDRKGAPYEVAYNTLKENRQAWFDKYPLLNKLCVAEVIKEVSGPSSGFVIVAGTTNGNKIELKKTVDNIYTDPILKNDGQEFPLFIQTPKNILIDYIRNNMKHTHSPITELEDFNAENLKSINQQEIRDIQNLNIIEIQTNLATTQNSNYKSRPLSTGISVGSAHYPRLAGSIGALCKLKNKSGIYLLSNHHVLVGPNGKLGNKILQPAFKHGGSWRNKRDIIGKIVWYRLDRHQDLAIAKLNTELKTRASIWNGKILSPSGIRHAETNMPVCKLGMTGYKEGTIMSTNCSVRIKDKITGETRVYYDQIITNKISSPEDSGSIVIEKATNAAIGVVIGGDDKSYSVINHLYLSSDKVVDGVIEPNCKTIEFEIESFI